MPKKRQRTPELDLTGFSSSDSDSDDAYSPSPPRRGNKASRRKRSASNRSTSPGRGHGQEVPLHAQFAATSAFLAPKSGAFGGPGTGVAARPKIRLRSQDDGKGGTVMVKVVEGEEPAPRQAAPDGVLKFTFLDAGAPSQGDQLAKLEHPEGTLLRTDYVKEKRGRPKDKGKKKSGHVSSDEDDDDASPSVTPALDSDDEDFVNLDSIVGKDAGWSTVRALVAAPSMQIPWLDNRFATPHMSKPRDPDRPSKRKKKKLDSDGNEKVPKPHKIRLYGSHPTQKAKDVKPPLLLVHHEPIKHPLKDTTLSHTPDVDLGKDVNGGMHASFFLIVRKTPLSSRHHLRLAICTASGEEGCWKKTENAIWMQDFPQLAAPVKAVANPTHTDFSRAFLSFLSSPQLGLMSNAQHSVFVNALGGFDFGKSRNVQLVSSLAGTFSGEGGLAKAGGLDSLAQAIDRLEPRPSGKWKVEYLTATTDRLPRRFLEILHAAAQGIPPREYELQRSERAQHASRLWHAATKGDKVVVVYPTEAALDEAARKNKEEKYHVRWEGRCWDELKSRDQRKTVLRKAVMKSGRLNHANMMLIVHQPMDSDKGDADDPDAAEQYEAFLPVGSHTPTLASWGEYNLSPSSPSSPSVTIAQHDLSAVYRCAAAPTWAELKEVIDELVPYQRPLKKYAEGDEPAATAGPRPEPKKRGRKKQEAVDSD